LTVFRDPSPKPNQLGSNLNQDQAPRQQFQNSFFSIQTQLGQTNTRIPPSQSTIAGPTNPPFTFFNSQQFSNPSSRPVTFPGQSFTSFSGQQSGGFTSNSFSNSRIPGSAQQAEQPRSIQSVFGSNFPTQQPNTFFNQGPPRFQSRPTPNNAQNLFQGSPQPGSGFNLPTNRQSTSQTQFPEPTFGGFRPIKRSFDVGDDEKELFVEDLAKAGTKRTARKDNGSKSDIGTRRSSHWSGSQNSINNGENKTNAKSKVKGRNSAKKDLSNADVREKMQNLLQNELAKVYFEEFAQENNEVDDNYYYYGDGDYYDDYYYYYEYLD